MSDLELRACDIKAGYVAWCRGEVTKRQAEEAFDWFVRALKADAWDEGLEAERDYISAFNNWREHINDHRPEPPANPYREDT